MEKGVAALQRGDLKKAEAKFLEVLETDPKHPFANLHLGNIFLSTGRFDMAFPALNRAIASNPGLVQAHLFLANLHERQGRLTEAIRTVQKAYMLFPEETSPEAKALSSRLARLRNQLESKTSFERGVKLLREGNNEAAEAAFRSVLALQAENVQAYHFLGLSLGIQNRFEEAIEQFEALLRIQPKSIDSRTRLSELYQSGGRLTDARSELETGLFFLEDKDGPLAQSLEEKLDDVENRIELKGFLDRSSKAILDKRVDVAIATLQDILKINPEHALSYFNLGNIWAQKNRFDLAELHFKKALKISPAFTEAYQRLGQVYGIMRSFGKAKQQYESALATPGGKLKPIKGRLKALIVQSEERMRQTSAAAENASQASREHIEGGDPEKALAFLERAVFLDPENSKYHFSLGELYEQKGDIDRALNEMRGALVFNPNLIQAHQNLGRLLEKKGYVYQAVKEWKLAYALQPSGRNKQELMRLARKLKETEKQTFALIAQAEEEAREERKTAAIEFLKKALLLAPDNLRIRLILGDLYTETRDVTAAYAELNAVLMLEEKHEGAKYRLGKLYSSAGQWRDAERIFQEMLQGEGRSEHIREKAETALALALKRLRNEKSAQRHLQRGNRFFSAHDYLAAIESYERILTIYPSHVRSLYQTGFSHENLSENEKAIRFYEKVLDLDPRHVQARQRLGFIHETEGKNEKAIQIYRATLPLFNGEDDPEAVWVKNRLSVLEKRLVVSINHVVLSYNSNPAGSSNPKGDLSSNLGIDLTYYIRKDRRIQIPFAVSTHNTFFFQSNSYFSSESFSLSVTGLDSPFSYSAGYTLRLGLAKDGVTGTDNIGRIGLTWTGALPSTIGLDYRYTTFTSVSNENFDAIRQNLRLSLTQRWGRDSATLSYRLADNNANLNDQASQTNGIGLSYNKALSDKIRVGISINFERVQFINTDSREKIHRRNIFRSLGLTTSYVLQKNLVFNLSYTEQRNRSNLPSGAITVEQRLSGQATSLGSYNQRLLNLSANWSF
ncbi:MAG: tetratricopeptide repeat protein [Nitrospira sp.]